MNLPEALLDAITPLDPYLTLQQVPNGWAKLGGKWVRIGLIGSTPVCVIDVTADRPIRVSDRLEHLETYAVLPE